MALRAMSRVAEAASEPAYHARTTVCSSPNASTAITRPTMVSVERSLARKTLRATSLRKNMVQCAGAVSVSWPLSR